MNSRYDIIVAGGGISGAIAAVAASREGAKVLLIERDGSLGGAATNGLVYPIARYLAKDNNGNIITVNKGLFLEAINRLQEIDQYNSDDYVSYHDAAFNQEALKYVLDRLTIESGVEVLFHTFISNVSAEGGKVKSVTVVNKSGVAEIFADYFIDCTGDADVAAKAGCSYRIGDGNGNCQPMTMCFRIGNVNKALFDKHKNEIYKLFNEMQENGTLNCPGLFITFNHLGDGILHFNSTRVINHSGIDAVELSRAEQEGRAQVIETYKFLKKYAKGFENCVLLSAASSIGVRESRLIDGDYVLTSDDVLKCRHFEDSIACGSYLIDIHNPKGKGVELKELEGVYYHIPYRCITPKGFDNIFVAGRCISATHEAQGACRTIPICASVGEAAGVAASLCVKSGVTSRELNIETLQHKIEEFGGKYN